MARSTSEPGFFIVMSSDLDTEILKMPPHIRNRMVNELDERATLKVKKSTYCSWNVRVHETEEGGLCLKEGWEEFLHDNSLDDKGAFEFLVLEYDGKMNFSIQSYLRVQIGALDQNLLSSGYEPFSKSEEFAASSKYPTFRVILKGSSYLTIPSKFRKEYLPLQSYTIILKNSDGATWNYTAYCNMFSIRLSGLNAFKKGNNVDDGEVCVLELESNIKGKKYVVDMHL